MTQCHHQSKSQLKVGMVFQEYKKGYLNYMKLFCIVLMNEDDNLNDLVELVVN